VELLDPLGGHAVQEAFDRDDPGLLEGIDLCRGDARPLHGVDGRAAPQDVTELLSALYK
jgi:hypothetical protein